MPLLVFGRKCPQTGVELEDTFNSAFSVENNLSCWRKCGAVPLTRLPLQSKGVRRELAVGAAAQVELQCEQDDPEIENLKRLQGLNHFYCDVLISHGFDGAQLRLNAPTRENYVAVTQPQSKDRIKAIKSAKTAGQLFFATGGKHLNSNEFFQAQESKKRDAKIKEMEKQKKERGEYCKEQRGAVLLLMKKGELTEETEKKFTIPELKMLLKWKKVKPPSSKKRAMVDAYIAAPKPKIQKVWCRSEEAALQALKGDVTVKDTALGVASQQMARAVGNNLSNLDQGSLDLLKTAIEIFEGTKQQSNSEVDKTL